MNDMCTGEFYLIVHKKAWRALSGRLAAKVPALEAGEIAIKLNIKVPEAMFKRPQIQATVTIPENAVTPPVLEANVLDNVREVLTQQTGMDVTVRVVDNLSK